MTAPKGLSKADLASWITGWISAELKIEPDQIKGDRTFVTFGMDSVHAMMMVGDLEEFLGRRLSPTLAWTYPTVEAMADHLEQEVPAAATATPSSGEDEAILARLDELSEEEIDRLLQERLESGTR